MSCPDCTEWQLFKLSATWFVAGVGAAMVMGIASYILFYQAWCGV